MAESKNFLNNAGLNFFDIKYNFINFLKNQSEFSDYNLEGSNLSVLLDILAYNTSQQGFYNTMVANEMFIDRATKRSSIVSLAKLVGYTPNTKKAAKAKVLITVSTNSVPDSRSLPRGSVFTGILDNNQYSFTNTEAYSFYPYTFASTTDPDSSENGQILTYACGPVELKQGVLNTKSFNVSSPEDGFLINDTTADKDSIRVVVLNSVTDITGINIPWFLSNDIASIGENSKVFFIEENNVGQLVLRFGDGILGKKLEVGNVVIVEYLSTAGQEANGIGVNDSTTKRSFTYEGDSAYTVLTLEPSNSGRERESSSSIKKNATLNFTARERAVTVKDYEGVILSAFNNNAAVRCWGGEDNDPPYYGKVFASIRPLGSTIISSEEKENLVKNILKEKNPSKKIIGAQPKDGAKIPGIRKWPVEYLPKIFDRSRIDQVIEVSDVEAKAMAQRLAIEEGVFGGMSSGGAVAAALKLIENMEEGNVVCIICDRGDKYLSTDLFE
jgi:hypothetical protein